MSGKYVGSPAGPVYVMNDDARSDPIEELMRDVLRARRRFLLHLPRKFPQFLQGMSTGAYVDDFTSNNPTTHSDLRHAAHVLPYDLHALRLRPAPVPVDEGDLIEIDDAQRATIRA